MKELKYWMVSQKPKHGHREGYVTMIKVVVAYNKKEALELFRASTDSHFLKPRVTDFEIGREYFF